VVCSDQNLAFSGSTNSPDGMYSRLDGRYTVPVLSCCPLSVGRSDAAHSTPDKAGSGPSCPLLSNGDLALGKKLYVGNLSYSVSSSDLEEMFSSYGTVQSAQVISDRESGRSKGFGFVEMGSDDEAQAAIRALNGQEHGGRPLTVNEARPREDRGGGGRGRGGGGGYGGGGRGGRY